VLERPPVSPSGSAPETSPNERTYPTGFGAVTFEELYNHTQRIVGYSLREKLGMTDPQDIDDCLQAGYFKVWQLLQQKPEMFAGKPKKYIVQAVVFRSKVQRFSHQRHYRKLVYDAQPLIAPTIDELNTRQIETWLDIEQAVQQVLPFLEGKPTLLLGLYTLLTQVSTKDVASTFGCGESTLRAMRKQVRERLAHALPGYGKPLPASIPTSLHPRPLRAPSAKTPLLTTRLLQGIYDDGRLGAPPEAPPVRTQPSVNDMLFPTRWNSALTLEAILTDPQVRRAAYAKVAQLGLSEADYDDCLQRGSIRLWRQLAKNPNFLADKGSVWTGIYLAYSGNSRALRRQQAREQQFTRPEFDWRDALEYLPLGTSDWTAQVDEALDFAQFVRTMAQQYADDRRKLLALYALTTSVNTADVAQLVGLDPKNFSATIGNKVKEDMRTLYIQWFEAVSFQPRQQLTQDEQLSAIMQTAKLVGADLRQLLALYVLTTSVKQKDVLTTFHLTRTSFQITLKTVQRLLEQQYRACWYAKRKQQ
jgi:DNA-directed RNA polymerase specialized sigma24 family protein